MLRQTYLATCCIEDQCVAVVITHNAFLYRVVTAAVHNLVGNRFCLVSGLVLHLHLYIRVGVVSLITGYVKADGLEEFCLAVAVVIPSCHNDGLRVVAHALTLLYHHDCGMQRVTFQS